MSPEQRRNLRAAELRARAHAHFQAGTTDCAGSVMVRWSGEYTDAARFQHECKALFRNQPVIAGLAVDLPAPGTAQVIELQGESAIIVRTVGGELRGFRNLCRHRGARLIPLPATASCELHGGRIRCPFHGWTYDLDGRLQAVPMKEGFAGANLTDLDLFPMPVSESCGLILVDFSSQSWPVTQPFEAPLQQELKDLQLHQFAPGSTTSFTARCNWKLALDTYCENYHFPILHGDSVGPRYPGSVSLFDDHAPHWRLHFPEQAEAALLQRPEREWPDARFSAVYFLFPATILVVGDGASGARTARLFRILPGASADTCHCTISDYHFPGAAKARQRSQIDQVTAEDYRMAEATHANLVSAPNEVPLLFGRHEPALQAFHCAVDQALQG